MTGSLAISYLIGRGYPNHQASHIVSVMEAKHAALDEPSLLNWALRMGMQ